MFSARLERVRELSASTRDFRFVRADGETTHYRPGQFFRFEFMDKDGAFERSYSLCNYDQLFGAELDLVISKVKGGRATALLFSENIEGLEATVTGPFGRLVLPEHTPGRLVMVATSVGLAPYIPILRDLESRDYSNVVLLLGIRDRSEFIYGDLLLEYARKHPWFELRLCLSREAAVASHEYDGYVNAQLEAMDVNASDDYCLLCGNPKMIDEAWTYLRSQDFGAKQVVREKYVFAREKKAVTKTLTAEQKQLIAEKMKKYS
ncbi:MAG: hypothetical protein HOC70_08125 [Gammaproteobacteria bacterium]|jgi:ferredoxin-NADP reductase|nr:hypothetical protein [Gammaproteobacteria bacterium]MBT4493198.1 hypothetical protein [Gammaproteobacteria bacterium]MBT7369634.1 hypothetical protein [Gammaproteobacteria bacterium]